jgi:pimeloyl-ACP methyl ester carboxylesterase
MPDVLLDVRAETAPTQFVDANGVRFAYRRLGPAEGVPLVFLQHFTGTMDWWDPSVVDGFARSRPVILFDNAGVSRSGGTTPDNIKAMSDDAVAFLSALGLTQVDLLGFSVGGFVAQEIALDHPTLVRRIILAGTGPQGGEGIVNLGHVLEQAMKASPTEPRLYLFFDQTPSSQAAGKAFIERQARRTVDRDPNSGDQTFQAQFKAIVTWGATRDPDWKRLSRISQPTLVVNGHDDIMVPSINSFVLFQHLPNARLVLYPDSGHGALFQFADDFVEQGTRFLTAHEVTSV